MMHAWQAVSLVAAMQSAKTALFTVVFTAYEL
jgi:hypothetical protein